MRALIDTCVIIDVLQKREPFFDDAHMVFLAAANNQFEGYISAKSVTDIYYLTHHFLHDGTKSRKTLDILFKLFSILDTTELDCRKALLSPISDYEDAILCETVLRAKIDCIITRNIKDFTKSQVRIFLPGEFLGVINQTEENNV